MRIGASTFIWVSPFGADTLDLIDRVRDLGFEQIEICVEDPDTIDGAEVRGRLARVDLGVSLWRPLAESENALAGGGLAHLRRMFA